jgi:hypothetical protein
LHSRRLIGLTEIVGANAIVHPRAVVCVETFTHRLAHEVLIKENSIPNNTYDPCC